MFTPSQQDVRHFFCETWRKWRDHLPMTPLETMAADWIALHPEYHQDLADEDKALATIGTPDPAGIGSPFLHLSLHLSISEQLSINQPHGIKQAFELLAAHHTDTHEAHHDMMECLGEILWHSQQSSLPPNGRAYLDAVNRRVGKRKH
jgi:DNA-directed RNA polymerase specialized sigma54-like protein